MDMEMETEFTAILRKGNRIYPHMRNEVLNLISYLKDIDWTEPWLIGLLVFHAVITTLTVVTRHHGNFQGIFFFLLLLLVYCSSSINEFAALHWKYFSRQQYFDSGGMFISIVFSSPILLNCLVMVGQWLWISGSLMVKVKQAQLRQQLRAENRLKKQRREWENQRRESENQRRESENQRRESENQKRESENQRRESENQRRESESQRRESESQRRESDNHDKKD